MKSKHDKTYRANVRVHLRYLDDGTKVERVSKKRLEAVIAAEKAKFEDPLGLKAKWRALQAARRARPHGKSTSAALVAAISAMAMAGAR